MKTNLTIIIMLLVFRVSIAQTNFHKSNNYLKADSIVTAKFQYLDTLLNIKLMAKEERGAILNRCNNEVNFIVKLTGIESTTLLSGDIGRISISESDYLNWSLWYFRNKNLLYFEDGEVKVKE